MTSLQRIRCAVGRRALPDALPVAPYMGNHGARISGVPIGQYCRSGEAMARAQFRGWELYGQDAVVAQSDNYYIAEGFGVEVDHYADSTPTLRTPAIQHLSEVYSLKVPDPQTDGRMPVYLEAIQRLGQLLGQEVAIRAPGTGPFSLASHLLGTERFLVELALADKDPAGEAEKALRHLMSLSTQALVRFSHACLAAGAHIVQAGDSLASIDMISPSMYRKWALPSEVQFFQEMKQAAARVGGMTLLHICGNMTSVLQEMCDSGADILELDSKVDLGLAKARVGDRVCLLGNLNPVALLWQGSVAEVERAAAQAIGQAAAGGGFILGSGCEVPVGAPLDNLRAMIRCAREYRYSGAM
jgi:uroporphyrinogen decarboxylase